MSLIAGGKIAEALDVPRVCVCACSFWFSCIQQTGTMYLNYFASFVTELTLGAPMGQLLCDRQCRSMSVEVSAYKSVIEYNHKTTAFYQASLNIRHPTIEAGRYSEDNITR